MADEPDLVAMTIEVVASYVAHNIIAPDDVPAFIAKTHAAIKDLSKISEPEPVAADAAPVFAPAVTVRKSLASREHILSLIDGKPYKTLKRHLSGHGLTPAEYRERYGLKKDYPLVAPAYSDHRREVAKTLGLGRKVTGGRGTQAPAPPPPAVEPAAGEVPAPAKPARKTSAPKPAAKRADEATPALGAPAVETSVVDIPAVAPPVAKPARKAATPRSAAKKAAAAVEAKTPVIEAPAAPETVSAATPTVAKTGRKAASAKPTVAKTARAKDAAPKKAASKTTAAKADTVAAAAKPPRAGRTKASPVTPAAPADSAET